jgi:hypothetical protein
MTSKTCSACGEEIKGRICQGLDPREYYHLLCAAKSVWESDPENPPLGPLEKAFIKGELHADQKQQP